MAGGENGRHFWIPVMDQCRNLAEISADHRQVWLLLRQGLLEFFRIQEWAYFNPTATQSHLGDHQQLFFRFQEPDITAFERFAAAVQSRHRFQLTGDLMDFYTEILQCNLAALLIEL